MPVYRFLSVFNFSLKNITKCENILSQCRKMIQEIASERQSKQQRSLSFMKEVQ